MSGYRGVVKAVWTRAEIETLAQMWQAGATARAIAAVLGRSRNAVIGMAHRAGCAPRPSPIRHGGRARGVWRTCQYPMWPDDLPRPPRPALFCGAPSTPGCSWCAAHHAGVWRSGTPSERRAADALLVHAAP